MCGQLTFAVILSLAVPFSMSGQVAAPPRPDIPPQTARQALLEMLLAQTPAAVLKHLPKKAQALVREDVAVLPLNELYETSSRLQQPGRKLETFDTGPILLRSEDPPSQQSIEVSVESEIDGLDEDELQLGLHIFRAGQPPTLPFIPTITCTMKSESGIWRLDDIAVTLSVPIADPAFLKRLADRLGALHNAAAESTALQGLRSITTAEVTYASMFEDRGFTCSLSDLGGNGESEPHPSAAMLINSELASGNMSGYALSLVDCSGSPVDHFRSVMVPENAENGLRAFCSDESGIIRYSDDGQASTCLSAGEPLP